MKRRWKILFGLASVVIISIFLFAWNFLPKLVLCPYRFDVNQHPAGLEVQWTPEAYDLTAEDYDVLTSDSVKLDAWLIHSQLDTTIGTIIMLHGIGSCKEPFLSEAKYLTSLGLNVVLFDMRAQGQSGGSFCTYGFEEKKDVKIFTDKILNQFPDTPIGLYGVSLGGAIAYQSLAYDERLSFGIIECTYDELTNVVREYTARHIGFHCNWIADFALWRSEQLAGFDSEEVSPYASAKKIRVPVFVAHGTADQNIAFEMGKRNFGELQHPGCVFYPVAGADHNNIPSVGGKKFSDAMATFILAQTLIKSD